MCPGGQLRVGVGGALVQPRIRKSSRDSHDSRKTGCEWQDSNLRTPARTDLESVTFGLSVTLAVGNGYTIIKGGQPG